MRYRRLIAAFACAVWMLLSLSGCAEREGLLEVRIAYQTASESNTEVFGYMTRKIMTADPERLCSLVIQLAMTEPSDESLTSVFPKKTTVRSVNISENGVVTVDFSEEYASLTDIRRTIADYCVVLTLFALSDVVDLGIRGVVITIEGAGDRYLLTPDDIVDNTDFMRLRDYEFVVYFPNREQGTLEADVFSRTLSDAEHPAESIVSILMDGRRSDGSVSRIVSSSTVLLGLEIHNRICYLDFNESFLNVPIENEAGYSLKLYAFVNSLCELSYIDRVQFLINGENISSESYDQFDTPYSPDLSLVS